MRKWLTRALVLAAAWAGTIPPARAQDYAPQAAPGNPGEGASGTTDRRAAGGRRGSARGSARRAFTATARTWPRRRERPRPGGSTQMRWGCGAANARVNDALDAFDRARELHP